MEHSQTETSLGQSLEGVGAVLSRSSSESMLDLDVWRSNDHEVDEGGEGARGVERRSDRDEVNSIHN